MVSCHLRTSKQRERRFLSATPEERRLCEINSVCVPSIIYANSRTSQNSKRIEDSITGHTEALVSPPSYVHT